MTPAPDPQPDAPAVSLRLMNGFELRRGAEPVSFPLSAQRLLAFLALQQRPVQRPYVAGKLWLDAPEDRALASLRSALWRANRPGLRLVHRVRSQLALYPGVRVDVHEATTQASRLVEGLAGEDLDVEGLTNAGELLPDWYDDWLLVEREKHQQLRLHALEALANRLTAAGRYGEAADAAIAAIAGEPLRESAHRALICVHVAEGNTGVALRHYERFRRLLRAELGLAPTDQLQSLVSCLADRQRPP